MLPSSDKANRTWLVDPRHACTSNLLLNLQQPQRSLIGIWTCTSLANISGRRTATLHHGPADFQELPPASTVPIHAARGSNVHSAPQPAATYIKHRLDRTILIQETHRPFCNNSCEQPQRPGHTLSPVRPQPLDNGWSAAAISSPSLHRQHTDLQM